MSSSKMEGTVFLHTVQVFLFAKELAATPADFALQNKSAGAELGQRKATHRGTSMEPKNHGLP